MTQIASIRAQTANKKLSKSSSQNYPNSFSENAKASAPSSFIGSSTGNPFLKSGFGASSPSAMRHPCSERPLDPQRLIACALIFIQIFAGNIILRHLVRANFPLIVPPGVFHASHDFCLERVSFLDQLAHTLRVHSL